MKRLHFLIIVVIIYIIIMNFVYWVCHPKYTQMEVLLRTHKNLFWIFYK